MLVKVVNDAAVVNSSSLSAIYACKPGTYNDSVSVAFLVLS